MVQYNSRIGGMQGEASTRLGFTDYFRVKLAWAKLLGAVPAPLKEWAHAAFAFPLGSALIAHLSIGEGPRRRGAGRRAPGVLWGLSYFCGVASRARARAGPLEDNNAWRMKTRRGSPRETLATVGCRVERCGCSHTHTTR
jgi:hypothetical protein